MVYPNATYWNAATMDGAKKPVRKRVVSIQEIEGHFPIYYTDTSPHCAICLSEIQASEPCRRTTCNHEFHAACIIKWWTKEKGKVLNCPTCREAQKVSVKKGKQVSMETKQKKNPSPTAQRRSQSQPLQQRHEETQSPLRRLLESVRLLITTSHEARTTAAPNQEASQIPNYVAVREYTEADVRRNLFNV